MERSLTSQCLKKIGQKVVLQGWADTIRDHGKITFIDLRDRAGLVQVVFEEKVDLSSESVIEVTGTVKERPKDLINDKIETGTIEIEAESVTVLNASDPLPFPIDTDGYDINEETRLKYRYLDLRRARLQKNIKLRSEYVQAAREYLFKHDFTEIETPLLTKSTPEGSRDFLVPSRLQPGKFFALPQSPQQYKQLLMSAGFKRYFQIARCLRDEDPRADRGYEHTQVDLELSFVTREQVMQVVEGMITYAVEKVGGVILKKPFPVITYKESMEKYGADKFDLRTDKEKKDGVLAFAWVIDFPFFEKTTDGGWTFSHNPFSQPLPEHEDWLLNKENIGDIITQQYDLVCNGYEVGGGSIRAHKPEILQAVFEIMGYAQEEIQTKFGHMLDAFKLGTPPHGGCASGVERMVMTLMGEEYLREVQAFPQTGRGRTSVMDAPAAVTPEQMAELGILSQSIDTTKSVTDQIKQKLDNLNISYQEMKHKAVITSEEAAAERSSSISQGAKALVMKADDKLIMLVVPGDKKGDGKAVKKALGLKSLEMAPKDMVEEVTQVQIGGVPPFGSLFNMPTYVDESLAENETIFFNAGSRTISISLSHEDFIRAEQPTIGTFAK